MVLLNVNATPGVSPIDEATHADYVLRVAQGDLPRMGQPLSEQTLREWSCRGSSNVTFELPPCTDGPLDPATYPAGGQQYNSAHPPLYYAVTALVARPLAVLTGEGLLGSARLVGIAWLTAGLWALLAALRQLGTSWTLGTAVAALVGLAPAIQHASSTVNNDASAVLAGALVLWVALRVAHGTSSWPALAVAAAVAAALKLVFLIALVPAAVVLLQHARRHPDDRARVAVALGAGGAAAAVVLAAWTLVHGALNPGDVENPVLGINTRDADRLPVAMTLRNLLACWPPLARPFVPLELLEQPQFFLWGVLIPLLFASAPLLGMVAARSPVGRDVSIGAALGMVAVPVAVQLHTYLAHGDYFPNIAPRYGLCVVPAVAVALASVARGRRHDLAAAGLAGTGTFALLIALIMSG